MADDRNSLPMILGACAAIAAAGYLGWAYKLEVDAVDDIESRIEKRFEHVPVSYFELTAFIRPGKDLMTHDYGTWSFVGLKRSYPQPFNQLFPSGSCVWVACERRGTDCLNLMDCGTGSCSDFEKEAKAFNPALCDKASEHGARSGWERLRNGK